MKGHRMTRLATAAFALALAAAGPAFPQSASGTTDDAATGSATGAEPSDQSEQTEQLVRVTSLLDGKVYAAADSGADTGTVGEPLLEVPAEWSEIGEIEDIALTTEGTLRGIVLDVGGFLGIGETTVLVPADTLRSVRVGADVLFLTSMTEDELRNLPEVDDTLWR
jgi:hypothetical protein